MVLWPHYMACRRGQHCLLKLKPSMRLWKKSDLGDWERGMDVGGGQAGQSISENADLLGFLQTAISKGYKEKEYLVSGGPVGQNASENGQTG